MSSGSELGAGAGAVGAGVWSYRSLELGAWSYWSKGAVARAGAGPTRDPGKHLYFFSRLFVLFVFLCYVLVKLRCSATFPLVELFFSAVEETKRRRRRRKEEGDDSKVVVAFFLLFCYATTQEGDSSNTTVAFFFFFCCVVAQPSEEGNGSNAVAFFLFLFLLCKKA
jgi:hypothetical protein